MNIMRVNIINPKAARLLKDLAAMKLIEIQDVPSKYITVFERLDNLPIIKKLPIESFGENLSALTNTVFETNDVQELFKKHFKTLKRLLHSEKEINKLFSNFILLISASNLPDVN